MECAHGLRRTAPRARLFHARPWRQRPTRLACNRARSRDSVEQNAGTRRLSYTPNRTMGMLTFASHPQARVVRKGGLDFAAPPAPRTKQTPLIREHARARLAVLVGLWPLTCVVLLALGLLCMAGMSGAPKRPGITRSSPALHTASRVGKTLATDAVQSLDCTPCRLLHHVGPSAS